MGAIWFQKFLWKLLILEIKNFQIKFETSLETFNFLQQFLLGLQILWIWNGFSLNGASKGKGHTSICICTLTRTRILTRENSQRICTVEPDTKHGKILLMPDSHKAICFVERCLLADMEGLDCQFLAPKSFDSLRWTPYERASLCRRLGDGRRSGRTLAKARRSHLKTLEGETEEPSVAIQNAQSWIAGCMHRTRSLSQWETLAHGMMGCKPILHSIGCKPNFPLHLQTFANLCDNLAV